LGGRIAHIHLVSCCKHSPGVKSFSPGKPVDFTAGGRAVILLLQSKKCARRWPFSLDVMELYPADVSVTYPCLPIRSGRVRQEGARIYIRRDSFAQGRSKFPAGNSSGSKIRSAPHPSVQSYDQVQPRLHF
jgi:hypothetical protein